MMKKLLTLCLYLCLCMSFTGCSNNTTQEKANYSYISHEELEDLTIPTNSADSMIDTEELKDSTESTMVDDYSIEGTITDDHNKTDKNSSIVTSYLESYDWDQLPAKKSFKELDALAPIPENMEELLNGMYRIDGHELTKQDIIPDNGMSIYYGQDTWENMNDHISIEVGYVDYACPPDNNSGLSKYIDYCVENNIWHIDCLYYKNDPMCLSDILDAIGKPDHVYVREFYNEYYAGREYDIIIVYEYDELSTVFHAYGRTDNLEMDKFIDWLSYNPYSISNVKSKVYSIGYIQEKIGDNDSFDDVYLPWDEKTEYVRLY